MCNCTSVGRHEAPISVEGDDIVRIIRKELRLVAKERELRNAVALAVSAGKRAQHEEKFARSELERFIAGMNDCRLDGKSPHLKR